MCLVIVEDWTRLFVPGCCKLLIVEQIMYIMYIRYKVYYLYVYIFRFIYIVVYHVCFSLHHNCRSSLMFVHYVFNQICIDAMLQSTSILFRCGVLSSFQSPICHNLSILCARRSLEALSPFNSFGENTFGLSSAELLFSWVVLGHGVSWYLASPGTWRSPLHLKKLPCLP